MEDLVGSFFDNIRVWLNKVIPQETKNCLRTVLGKVVGIEQNNNVVVRLIGSPEPGDGETYGNQDLRDVLSNIPVRIGDVVVVAYTTNNLTNAFILFNENLDKDGNFKN